MKDVITNRDKYDNMLAELGPPAEIREGANPNWLLLEEEFDMSMMRELEFFHWVQIKQDKYDIFIHQHNYTKELLNGSKFMSTPMGHGSVYLS